MLHLSQRSKERLKTMSSCSKKGKKRNKRELCSAQQKGVWTATSFVWCNWCSSIHFLHLVPFFVHLCLYIQQLRLVFLDYYSVLHHYIFSAHSTYILPHQAPLKTHRELLHHHRCYNHSSTTNCSPGSCSFQGEKELVL